MNTFMIKKLIWKDLSLSKGLIALFTVLAMVSIVIALSGGNAAFYTGTVLLACDLIIAGVIVITVMVVGERKQQFYLSILSLPLSRRDYIIAKLCAGLIFCCAPLLTALIFSLTLILSIDALPDGWIPIVVVFALEMFAGYCLMLALVLISPTDLVAGFSIGGHNIFINFFIFGMLSSGAIQATAQSETLVWNGTVQTIIGVELLIAVLAIAAVFIDQSRKKDII